MANVLVNEFRRRLKEAGNPDADLPDDQLTWKLYGEMQRRKLSFSSQPQDFQDDVRRISNRPKPGRSGFLGALKEAPAEFASTLENKKGSYKGFAGMVGGALGATDFEDDMMLSQRRHAEKAARIGSSVTNIDMVDSWGSFGRWLMGATGAAAADAVEIVASMGLGAAAGRWASATKSTDDALELADQVQKAQMIGAGVGSAGTSTAQNTAQVYADLYPYTKLDKNDKNYLSPAEARMMGLGAGAASGALDSVVPLLLFRGLTKRLGREASADAVGDFLKKMPGSAVFLPALGEAGTEASQEVLQMLTVKSHTGEGWSEQDWSRLRNAGALGFVGGGVLGGGAAGVRKLASGPGRAETVTEEEDPGVSTEVGIPLDQQAAARRKLSELRASDLQEGDFVIRPGTKTSGKVIEKEGDWVTIQDANGDEQRLRADWLVPRDDLTTKKWTREELERLGDDQLNHIKNAQPNQKKEIEGILAAREAGKPEAKKVKRPAEPLEVVPINPDGLEVKKTKKGIEVRLSGGGVVATADVSEEDGKIKHENLQISEAGQEHKGDITRLVRESILNKARADGLFIDDGEAKLPWTNDDLNDADLPSDELVDIYQKVERMVGKDEDWSDWRGELREVLVGRNLIQKDHKGDDFLIPTEAEAQWLYELISTLDNAVRHLTKKQATEEIHEQANAKLDESNLSNAQKTQVKARLMANLALVNPGWKKGANKKWSWPTDTNEDKEQQKAVEGQKEVAKQNRANNTLERLKNRGLRRGRFLPHEGQRWRVEEISPEGKVTLSDWKGGAKEVDAKTLSRLQERTFRDNDEHKDKDSGLTYKRTADDEWAELVVSKKGYVGEVTVKTTDGGKSFTHEWQDGRWAQISGGGVAIGDGQATDVLAENLLKKDPTEIWHGTKLLTTESGRELRYKDYFTDAWQIRREIYDVKKSEAEEGLVIKENVFLIQNTELENIGIKASDGTFLVPIFEYNAEVAEAKVGSHGNLIVGVREFGGTPKDRDELGLVDATNYQAEGEGLTQVEGEGEEIRYFKEEDAKKTLTGGGEYVGVVSRGRPGWRSEVLKAAGKTAAPRPGAARIRAAQPGRKASSGQAGQAEASARPTSPSELTKEQQMLLNIWAAREHASILEEFERTEPTDEEHLKYIEDLDTFYAGVSDASIYTQLGVAGDKALVRVRALHEKVVGHIERMVSNSSAAADQLAQMEQVAQDVGMKLLHPDGEKEYVAPDAPAPVATGSPVTQAPARTAPALPPEGDFVDWTTQPLEELAEGEKGPVQLRGELYEVRKISEEENYSDDEIERVNNLLTFADAKAQANEKKRRTEVPYRASAGGKYGSSRAIVLRSRMEGQDGSPKGAIHVRTLIRRTIDDRDAVTIRDFKKAGRSGGSPHPRWRKAQAWQLKNTGDSSNPQDLQFEYMMPPGYELVGFLDAFQARAFVIRADYQNESDFRAALEAMPAPGTPLQRYFELQDAEEKSAEWDELSHEGDWNPVLSKYSASDQLVEASRFWVDYARNLLVSVEGALSADAMEILNRYAEGEVVRAVDFQSVHRALGVASPWHYYEQNDATLIDALSLYEAFGHPAKLDSYQFDISVSKAATGNIELARFAADIESGTAPVASSVVNWGGDAAMGNALTSYGKKEALVAIEGEETTATWEANQQLPQIRRMLENAGLPVRYAEEFLRVDLAQQAALKEFIDKVESETSLESEEASSVTQLEKEISNAFAGLLYSAQNAPHFQNVLKTIRNQEQQFSTVDDADAADAEGMGQGYFYKRVSDLLGRIPDAAKEGFRELIELAAAEINNPGKYVKTAVGGKDLRNDGRKENNFRSLHYAPEFNRRLEEDIFPHLTNEGLAASPVVKAFMGIVRSAVRSEAAVDVFPVDAMIGDGAFYSALVGSETPDALQERRGWHDAADMASPQDVPELEGRASEQSLSSLSDPFDISSEEKMDAAINAAKKMGYRTVDGHPSVLVAPEAREQITEENARAVEEFLQGGGFIDGTPQLASQALSRALEVAENLPESPHKSTIVSSLRTLSGHSLLKRAKVFWHSWDTYRKETSFRAGKYTLAWYKGGSIHMGDMYKLNPDDDFSAMEALLFTLAEEMGHAVTSQVIDAADYVARSGRLPPGWPRGVLSVDELRKLDSDSSAVMSWLAEQNNGRFRNGLKNHHEMWVNFATNPDFRNWIARQKMPSSLRAKLRVGGRIKSLYDWFVRLISRFFGGEQSPNVLGILDEHFKNLIEMSEKVHAFGGGMAAHTSQMNLELFNEQEAVRHAEQIEYAAPPTPPVADDAAAAPTAGDTTGGPPTWWEMFKVNKESKTVYKDVAEVLIQGAEDAGYFYGTSLTYAPKLGLDQQKLERAMHAAFDSRPYTSERDLVQRSEWEASVVNGTVEAGAAAINEVESVFSSFISTLSPEAQDNPQNQSVFDTLRRLSGGATPEVLKKLIQRKAVTPAEGLEELSKYVNADKRIQDFGNDALEVAAARMFIRLAEDYKRRAEKVKAEANERKAENDRAYEEKLLYFQNFNRRTLFDQAKAKVKLHEELQKLVRGRKPNQLLRNMGMHPSLDSAAQADKIDADKLYEALAELVDTTDIDRLKTEEAYNVIPTDLDIGMDAAYTPLARAAIATMLASKNSAGKKYFTISMRLARNKALAEMRSDWSLVERMATDDDFDSVPVEGHFTDILKELKAERKELKRLKDTRELDDAKSALGEEVAKAFGERSMRYREFLGEMPPVELYDGAKLRVLRWNEGKLKEEVFEYRSTAGRKENEAHEKDQMRLASELIEIVRSEQFEEQYGDQPALKGYLVELANQLQQAPIAKLYQYAMTGRAISVGQSFQQAFSEGGVHGNQIATALNRFNRLYSEHLPRITAQGHKVSRRIKLLHKELAPNERLPVFLRGFYNKVFHWYNERPDLLGDKQANRQLWKELSDAGSFGYNYTPEAYRRFEEMVRETEIQNTQLRDLSRKIGLSVKDNDLAVNSLITGDVEKLYRRGAEQGVITVPRMLVSEALAKSRSVLIEGGVNVIKRAQSLANQAIEAAGDETDGVGKDIASMLEEVIPSELEEHFLEPFLTEVGAHMDLWTITKDDEMVLLTPERVRDTWEAQEGSAGRKLAGFIKDISEAGGKDQEFAQAAVEILDQLHKRSRVIVTQAEQVRKAEKARSSNPMLITYGTEMDSSLSSRNLSSILPQRFLQYAAFDETTSKILLGQMIQAATFGRDGKKIEVPRELMMDELQKSREEWAAIASKTGMPHLHRKGRPDLKYTPQEKRAILATGLVRDWKHFQEIVKQARLYAKMEQTWQGLQQFLNDSEGWRVDNKAGMEFLTTVAFGAVNQPKTAFTALMSIGDIVKRLGLNPTSIRAVGETVADLPRQVAGSLLERFGMTMATSEYEEMLNPLFQKLTESLDYSERLSEIGVRGELHSSGMSAPFRRYLRKARALATATGGAKNRAKLGGGKFTPGSLRTAFTAPFSYLSNVVNRSLTLSIVRMLDRRVRNAAEVLDAMEISPLDKSIELTAEQLGFKDTTLDKWVTGNKDMIEWLNNRLAAEGMSLTTLAQQYRQRRAENKDALPLEPEQAIAAWNIAMSEITYDAMTGKPMLFSSGKGKFFAPLLNWSLAAWSQGARQMMDKDGRLALRESMRYLLMSSAWLVPIGVALTLFTDWWDEEVLGKPSNLRKVPPSAAIPVVGLPMAMSDPRWNMLAMIERSARASNVFGIGQEVMSQTFGAFDTSTPHRDFSRRVLAVGSLLNVWGSAKNYLMATDFSSAATFVPDYSQVVRPLAFSIGLNGLLQHAQAATNLFPDLAKVPGLSHERRVADVIGMRNILRSHAKVLGMEMRASRGLTILPSATQVAVRRMERSAYANDTEGFLEAYREAIAVSKAENPQKDIADKFKVRNIKNGITQYAMSDQDWIALLSVLDDDERARIQSAVKSHNYYLSLIGGKPRVSKKSTTQYSQELRSLALH